MSSVCVITRAVLKEHTEPVLTSFYLEKDKLTEVHPHLEGRSLLGNIYVGKVKHVVKNIDAAFVEIAGGQTCYLPFKEAQAPVLTNRRWDGRLLAGDEILVQVMRDALKTKEPALTAKISLECGWQQSFWTADTACGIPSSSQKRRQIISGKCCKV